jgi:cobalt-zinc-cadmium efflux system protein
MGNHHSHQHEHHGHHSHSPRLSEVNRAFKAGILLNIMFVVVEVVVGLSVHSMSLLTDAGHNISDIASLAISLLAFRLAKIKASPKFTYGYQKTTILVALVNVIILLLAMGIIGWEAIERFGHPRELPGATIAWTAALGILVNGFSAWLFYHNKEKDMNIKAAYLHLVADAAVSLGVVVTGVIIYYTGWYWADSLSSFAIILAVLISSWSLLKDAVRLSLDGVPKEVDLEKIKRLALKIKGITGIHHIHVWALSTTQNALTAHLVIEQLELAEQIKREFKHELSHLRIDHCTLETELSSAACEQENCADPTPNITPHP